MSVLSADPLTTERVESDDGTITYNVTWQVVTTDKSDGIITASNAALLPKRGDSYTFGSESDQNAICRSRKLNYESAKETRKKWLVSLEYSTKGNTSNPQDQSGGGGGSSDPIDWSWRVKLNTWTNTVAPERDRNGRAFVNVCGEPFMPPPEKEQQRPLIVLDKNDRWMDLSKWAAAIGKVNSDAGRWGLGVRCIKLRSWTATERWLGPGNMYFEHHMECEINADGFYYEPPNLGMNFIDGVDADGNPDIKVIRDKLWIPVSRPQKLDQFGAVIPAGQPAVFFDQAGGALRRFELEDEYDFAGILPTQLPGNFQNAS